MRYWFTRIHKISTVIISSILTFILLVRILLRRRFSTQWWQIQIRGNTWPGNMIHCQTRTTDKICTISTSKRTINLDTTLCVLRPHDRPDEALGGRTLKIQNYRLAQEMSYHSLCTNTFLLLQKHLTSGTELNLIGWKIVPNEEHVQCDHRFASPLANEPSGST